MTLIVCFLGKYLIGKYAIGLLGLNMNTLLFQEILVILRQYLGAT